MQTVSVAARVLTHARALVLLAAPLAAVIACASPAASQTTTVVDRTERISLPQSDGITLSGRLMLPPGKGPFPGVVVLSLAGSDDLVDRLNGLGFAVLLPNRRGLGGSPELLLRATFDRLVEDARTAEAYLRARPEVDGSVIGLMGQGGETMVTALAAAADSAGPAPAFVVLVGAPGLRGVDAFRIEQDFLAAQQGYDARARTSVDGFVTELNEIVSLEPNEVLRGFRIDALMAALYLSLPRDPSSLPLDAEGQAHFFASPWWRDFFMFDPEKALGGLTGPTLAMVGDEDPVAPFRRFLPGVRAGLAGASLSDATVCLLPGFVQHSFNPATLDAIEEWLRARLSGGKVRARAGLPRPRSCIDEPASGG